MRLGRLLGVDIYLNPFFLILVGLFFAAGILGQGLIAFLVVFLHEMSHVLAARRSGIRPGAVELLPFGGVARMGSELVLKPDKEIKVALAGPACNLVLAGVALALKGQGIWPGDLGPFFLRLNLLMAAFNLLPALPLDGGRILRALLSGRIGLRAATYRFALLGQICALVMFFLGAVGVAFRSGGLDLAILGAFLFFAALREKKMAAYYYARHLARKKDELSARRIMPVRVMACLEKLALGEAVKPFLPGHYQLVIMFDASLHMSGVLSEGEIIEGLLKHGPYHPIGELRRHE